MNKPAFLRNHALRHSKVFSNAAVAFGLCLVASTALAQTNFLSNSGVESGVPGLWVTNVVDWSGSSSGGDLVNGGASEAHGGVNYIRMNAYGAGTRQFSQRFPLTAGQVYSADAWMRTESGANAYNPTSANAVLLLQFYDVNDVRIGPNVVAPSFGAGGPTSWTSYGTGPALAPPGTVTGRVVAFYQGFGLDQTTNGYLRFDDFRATTSTATQAGSLKNPDFETQPAGTLSANNIPYWTALGNAGAVITNVHRNGRFSFNVYYTENLLAQTWAATSGVRYMSEGYINSLGITSTNNARGLIIMDFLDATGTNILATYLGAAVTNGSPTNSWILSHAEGIAPPGTVFGRTLCAVIGPDDGFVGNLYFDDLTQATVASSATTCGVISNPGFDDGLTGNASALSNGLLAGWTWVGGTNAGFIQQTIKRDGPQALAITFPQNLMQQSFAASSTSTNKSANAGFEIGPAGGATPPSWSTYGEAGQESWAAETGTNGVAFRGWVTNGFGGLIQDIPVNSAQGGVFSFSIRGNAEANFQSSSQEAWIKMEFWKQGEGSFRSQVSNSVYSALTGSPGTWQTFTIGATNSDSQVDLVKILVGFGNAVAPGGAMACRWDNASLVQSTPGGMTYVVEGYINNPTLDRMTGTAYGAYLLEFYNGTDLVSVVDTLHFTSTNAADSWQKFSVTNWSPYSGTVSGKLSATILGSSTNFSGALYFDTACVTPTNVPHSNVSSGAIFNPGFEYTANGTKLKYVDSWTNFGFDGAVQSTFKRSGEHALQIFFTETLAGQYWNATGGYRYANSAYAFTPSTDRFAGHSNLQAVLVMEFLNATGGVLISYASSPFKTNAPANVWSNLTVSGMAPNGTVRARTLVGIVGSTTGYAGSVYFDDVSQSILSTGGTTSCGILQNPGFDDGLPGNIDSLQLNGDLPAWVWLGGTNGGFVQTDYKYDGFQALGITFPHQLAVQSFTAQTGMSYILSGRIMNPAAQRLQDSAYGVFLLQFISGSNVISTKESAHFTTNNAADVWTYFAVTSRAPISGTFTGRVAAFLQGDHNGDTGFAGVVYYDGLCLTATNIPFTVTTNGALENPGFEDSACGTAFEFVDNWTALGNAGVVDCTVARSGANSLQIYFPANLMQQDWPATPGDKYASSGFVFSASSAPLNGGSTNDLQALVIQQFINATGGVLVSYVSNPFVVTNAEDVWVSLYAAGVAPQGTVTGRTLIGLVGTTNGGFSGAVYFDDIGQSTVWTQAPVSSLLYNAGYDDGPPGNVADLALTGDLPNWTWLGGTNAGFVQRSFKSNEEQALAITFPNNLMAQTFPVSQSGNVLKNSGFEIGGLSNWTAYSEASQESWAAETGTNGMAFHGWVAGGFGGFFQDVPVSPSLGNVFTFTVRGNAEADFKSSSRETWIKIEFWKTGESSPRYVASNSVYAALTNLPGVWQTFTLVYTNNDPDINLAKPVVGFGNAVGVGSALACRWDNASLTTGLQTNYTGYSYVLEGYIYNPTLDRMTGTAYGTYLLEFYNNGTDLVSVVDALHFTSTNAANTWQKFAVTNRAPWTGNINGRASATILGNVTNFSGALYFDALRLTRTNIPATNASCGAIFNPGFEYTAKGTQLKYVDNWTALGNAGDVQDTVARTGNKSLHFYFTETLAAQDWAATGLYRYANTAYAYTPTNDRFAGNSNLQAVLVMQFYNATGGLMVSYTSNPFKTNAAAGVWSNLSVSGIAPNGAVTGRTLVGIVGTNTAYAGSVYFDDICQSIVSTGGTTSCGLLQNPGFDDGIPGNIADLQTSGNLPAWQWLGGTNGGFVQADFLYDNFQALAITFPDQLAVQTFPAQTGMSYVVSGRIMNPSTQRITNSARGQILLQFFDDTNLVSTRATLFYTKTNAADTWLYYSVTGRAPSSGSVTGRVAAYLQGDGIGNTDFVGAVYFDGFCVTATNIPYVSTTNGALLNPGFEDSGCGTALEFVDNWTALGNAGVVDCTVARSGANSLQIYFPENLLSQSWDATPGDKYASSGYVYTASSSPLSGSNALQALLIQQFYDSTGGLIISYASNPFTVTNPANVWTPLYAIGVAPQGTTKGRTIVGLVGPSSNFSGSVYFDDVGQSVVWTQAPVFSVLHNAGFDDGPPGNVADLALAGDLPNWTWLGGTNAGFIQRSFKSNEEQALAITFPNNLMAQLFPISQSGNKLQNPGFEIGGLSNWTAYSEASQESWANETGTNGMSFHGWVPGGFGGFYQDVPAVNSDGNVYTFTIRGNAEPDFKSSSQETWIKMEFWKQGEGSPRFIASNSVYSALTNLPNTWQTFTLVYTNNDPDINLVKPVVGFGNAVGAGSALACRWDNATLRQSGPANSLGMSYVLEGYIYNPTLDRMTGTAYGAFLLEFYNDSTDLVSVVDTLHFTSTNAANTWQKFSVTNRAPWSGNIQGRASATILGNVTNFSGALYFDALRLTATNIPATNTSCGAIFNPGFEYTAKGTQLKYVDNWTGLGNAGDVQDTYARTGNKSLHFYFTETLAAQTWSATGLYRYANTAYAYTPTNDKFAGNSNLQALLVMEFYNATGGLMVSYASNPFRTNAIAGVWSNLTVSGIAPNGAVQGRTLVGIVGTNTGYSGSVYFDDICQSIVSTGGTTSCGVLQNPGFDDGIPGNIADLQTSGNLPAWQWLGGTNGGFVQADFLYDNFQSLGITFPDQLAVQTFPAQTGMSYVVSGRIMNPSTQRITNSAKGQFLLQFFQGTNLVSTKSTLFYTKTNAADTWLYYSVTGRAPSSGSVTGRVAAYLQGDGIGNTDFVGAVYFDGICVTATNIPFTTTTNGAIRNPGFEDSGCGTVLSAIDNWIPLGNAGQVDCSIAHAGANSLQIYFPGTLVQQDWAATPGDKYASSGFVYSSSSAPLTGDTNTLLALVIQQFINSTGGVIISYVSNPYSVTNAEDTWVSLYAIGVAPQGTVTGRTLVGLVGTNAGFSGSVYFDDVGQSTVWTQAPVSSLLYNAGYDDNPPGNVADLALTGDLPNWTWLGGTNAGFIQRSFKSNEEQALAITFPNNLMAQTFPVSISGNALRNPGFEIGSGGASNWSTYSEASQESWAAETGTNGMAFHGWVPGGFGGFFQDVPVSPSLGNVFTFTVRGNAEADFKSSSRETWIKIEFWKTGESSPRYVASNSVYAALTNLPGVWQTFTLVYTNNDPDINLAKPVVGFGNAVGVGAALACRWDNASLTTSLTTNYTGYTYVLEGYIYNPTLDRMTGTAYGAYLLEFYNDSTDLVSVVDTLHFTSTNAANTWQKFSVTNRAPWSGNINGRASATILGNVTNFSGALYFDALRLTRTNIPMTNAQSGALFNPGFEYTAKGTQLKYVDNWTALGNAGDVQDTYARSGNNALHIYFTETLVGQTWSATGGYRYGCSAYAYTPTNDKFAGNSNLQALLVMEYLDATGGVLLSYASNPFKTNAVAGVWSNLTVTGVAPAATVQGRTLIGIVGTNSGYSGAVYFDDVSQSLISTGGTVAGILHNPGFDDGVPGNASLISGTPDLPYWTWLGGTNAGFVQTTVNLTPPQALAITFPQNLAAQTFAASNGMSYVYRGMIYNPSSERIAGDAYGALLIEFYSGTNLISVKEAGRFTTNTPADVWTTYSVTSRPPATGGPYSGRVSVAILGSTTGFAGALYFDNLRLTETNLPFSNTNNGAIYNPGFEYSEAGTVLGAIDYWTALGNAGNVDGTVARTGGNSLKIYFPGTLVQQDWAATPGDKYACSGFAYTASADDLTGDTNTLLGLVVMQFLDSTGGVLISYASNPFTPTNAANVWESMYTIGVAPQGTVTGRTLVGLVGTNAGFSGSIYFDDIGQSTIWTDAPVTSLLRNSGYDDGPPGNADALQNSYDLPNWQWLGGTNAGFVQRTFKTNEEQALAITFPNNLMAQVFNVSQGPNVLRNDGFEIGAPSGPATNWYQYSEASLESWAAETGTNGMSFHGWVPGGFGGFGQDVRVVNGVGNIYQFTIRGNAEPNFRSTSQETWIKMEFWKTGEGSPRSIASNSVYSALTNLPNTWQTFTLTRTNSDPQVDLVKVIVGFGNAQAPGGAMACRWDNASLVQISSTPTTGMTYVLDGYIYNPASERMTGTAYGTYLLEFYNGTDLYSVVDAGKFTTNNAPNTWTKFSVTNRSPWAGSIYGRASATILGSTTNFSGALYFDKLSLTATNLPVSNTNSGAIFNPGFEYSAHGTVLGHIDNWLGLGNAGGLDSTFTHSGDNALKIYFPETLIAQTWPVTQGWKYATSGYVATPTNDRLKGIDPALQALVILQYMNATGGVIISYVSSSFTTNNPAGVWTNLTASGVAPVGSVLGRTLVGLIGPSTGFSGSVYFDDITQSIMSTGTTTSGLLKNPGFDDGPPGNAAILQLGGQFPSWRWLGGNNAGFVARDQYMTPDQSLVITYPLNGAAQDYPAISGHVYKLEGYMFTPAAAKFNSDGSSWGEMSLSFYANGSTNPAVAFTRATSPFRKNQPANTWVYFSVTATSPVAVVVTGRVSCTVQSVDLFGDVDLDGVIYYDNLTLTDITGGGGGGGARMNGYAIWQAQMPDQAKAGPDQDYDGDGMNNWSEYVAGTKPDDTNSFFAITEQKLVGDGSVIIRWNSETGRVYSVSRAPNFLSEEFKTLNDSVPATPPENVYTDTPPEGVDGFYRIGVGISQ